MSQRSEICGLRSPSPSLQRLIGLNRQGRSLGMKNGMPKERNRINALCNSQQLAQSKSTRHTHSGCCGGLHHPARSFIGSLSKTRESRIPNERIIDCTALMRTIKPQNVMHQSTNPGHNQTQYKIIQWDDRRRPHTSQWPKPAYHHSPLTESAHPENEPIPKPELSIS